MFVHVGIDGRFNACNVYCHLMFGIAYRYIHVFVYTGHILEMEDVCNIKLKWPKKWWNGGVITKKDTKWMFLIIFKGKGCKYCMCYIVLEYALI